MTTLNFELGREHAIITLMEEGTFHVIWGGDDFGGEFIANTVGELIDQLPFFLEVDHFAQLREVLLF